MKKKKKHFILLEILIALALVSFSILPFLSYPTSHLKRELDFLFTMELEKIAQNELANMHQEILKEKVPKEVLFSKEEQKELYYPKKMIAVYLNPKVKRKYRMQKNIKWKTQKVGKNGEVYSIVLLRVNFILPKHKKKTALQADMELCIQTK